MTYEFKEIIKGYQKASKSRIQTVIATIVDVDGSSYRRPGVGMLILENGEMIGAVSGGCVEKEVLRQSREVFENRTPKMMTYDGRYRLGCEGILYILIEPFELSTHAIGVIKECLKSRVPFKIKSYFSKEEGTSVTMGSMVSFKGGEEFGFANQPDTIETMKNMSLDCFDSILLPCFRLIIIGAEHDAMHLCLFASATGWEVEVISSPKDPKQLTDFPGANSVSNYSPENLVIKNIDTQTAIILMTHNFAKDLLYLKKIIDTQPVYIGLLGPSKRREKLLSALIEYYPEVSIEFLDSIHGPAGLNIGAETPEEIALSILSEILAVSRNKEPFSLKRLHDKIHVNLE